MIGDYAFPNLPLQAFPYQFVNLDHQGQVCQLSTRKGYRFAEQLSSGFSLQLIALPGGLFQMGSPHGQGYPDETSRHLVFIAPFLMAQSPITQQQWQIVTGKGCACRFHGPDLPVDRVSWQAAQAFCRALSQKTGHTYRLPSESQWEYACRAGMITPFNTGETITTDYANYCGDHTYRDEPPGEYRHTPIPVGTFLPNPAGIYDLHGNLWEWCADRWHADYTGAPFDSDPWEISGEAGYRVARGGSWHEPPVNCRSATRLRVSEQGGDDMVGLRVVMLPA